MNRHLSGAGMSQGSRSARDMDAAGMDIIPERKKPTKKGHCPNCGTQTHEVKMFGKRVPMTVEGQVFQGICLRCNPIEGLIRRSPGPSPIQNAVPLNPAVNPAINPPVPTTATATTTTATSTRLSPNRPSRKQPSLQQQQQQQQQQRQEQQLPQPHYQSRAPLQQPQPVQDHRVSSTSRPPMGARPLHQSLSTPANPAYPNLQRTEIPLEMPPPQPQFQQIHQPHATTFHPQAESGIRVPQELEVAMGDDVSVLTWDIPMARSGIMDDFSLDMPPPPQACVRPGPESSSRDTEIFGRGHSSRNPHHQPSQNNLGNSPPRKTNPLQASFPPTRARRTVPAPVSRSAGANLLPSVGEHQYDSLLNGGSGPSSTYRTPSTQMPAVEIQFQPSPTAHQDRLNPPRSSAGATTARSVGTASKSPPREYSRENGTTNNLNYSNHSGTKSTRSTAPPLRGVRGSPDDVDVVNPLDSSNGFATRDSFGGGMAHAAASAPYAASTPQPLPPRDTEIQGRSYAKAPDDKLDTLMEDDSSSAPSFPRHTRAFSGDQKPSPQHRPLKSVASNQTPHASRAIDPETIRQLVQQLSNSSTDARKKTFKDLAGSLTADNNGQRSFSESGGVQAMIETMWDEMGNWQVQDAALDLLLTLSSSMDAQPTNDFLTGHDAFCDALLISMETHDHRPSVQLKACTVFSCLAAASANNTQIHDGTMSGATIMVLKAMHKHQQNREIQRAGLQALFYQCSFSSHSENNKRSLVKSTLDDGTSGIDVITAALELFGHDFASVGWACQLIWILTSSEDIVRELSSMPMIIVALTQVCQQYTDHQSGDVILEACFGALGNLAHVENSHMELQQSGAIELLINGLERHIEDYHICNQACAALANLTGSLSGTNQFLRAGGCELLVRSIRTHISVADFVSEAIRVLVCLSANSVDVKRTLVSLKIIPQLFEVLQIHQSDLSVSEMCYKFLASLTMDSQTAETMVSQGYVDFLFETLGGDYDEQILEANSLVVRNLSCQLQDVDPLVDRGAAKLMTTVMLNHRGSLQIQLSGCSSIWNFVAKSRRHPENIVDGNGVEAVVKAMQNHMDSSELMEEACGALWSLVSDSIERKKDVVASGAIDAVACTMVMHQQQVATLVMACGVLSSLSFEGALAEAIANAQGVNVVVEAMCNNDGTPSLLELGCIVLRNILLQFPNFANEASAALSPVLRAMQSNKDEVSFLEEACSLLWVFAGEGEDFKAKITALDGISVLMECLNSPDEKLLEAARGAFSLLAAS